MQHVQRNAAALPRAGGAILEPVVIRGPDGEEFAVAIPLTGAGEPVLTFNRVLAGKGRLLSAYFLEGIRLVAVDCGDFQLRGALSTHWAADHRVWTVDLRPVLRGEEALPCAGGTADKAAPPLLQAVAAPPATVLG